MPPNPTPLPEIPPAVASRKAQAVPSSQRTASHPAPSSAPLTACDWASCDQPLGCATGLRPRIAASDPSSPLGRPRARQPPRKSSRPNPLHRSHSLRSEMYPALRRYSTHTLRSPSPERRGGQGVRTGTVRHRAPLAATKQGPYRPRLPPAEIRHATHLVHPGARRRTRLPGDPPTRHLGQRQASDRRRERPMAPTHEQRPFRLDRRVLRRRRASHAAQHGSDARQGCGPGVLRDPQYDRPTPDSDPPCRDRGGQWTGGGRDWAVALGLPHRRQTAAGHPSRGLGQVHRALGTAKRTLAHGGRRLEQRLAIAHGCSHASAGPGAAVRRTSGAMVWTQVYDPLHSWLLSTLVAALPILVLFGLLAGLKLPPHWCAIAAAATAVLVAVTVFGMPLPLAGMSFLYGVAFGLLKIAWIVLAAVYLYDVAVHTGQFEIMKESVAGITPDRRLQVLLVAFCFGAFIEGAAGFGAPVAIAGAFMIGLGFKPFHAAALNLLANTSPVAWGAIGTPVHTLAAVSGLPESDLSAMVGRILPFTGIIVPFWLVRAMVGWRETFEVLPAILVVGVSFSLTQYLWSNHIDSNLVDIAGGIVSLIATVIFLRFWQPKRIWRFEDERAAAPVGQARGNPATAPKHTAGQVAKAWMPFAILSLTVLVWGLPAIKGAINKATTPIWNVPLLHNAVN